MSRVPTVDADRDSWGTVLNDYLSQGHNADGSNKNVAPVFNVKDYGAVGDGTTDDTAAIRAAITAACATNGTLAIPQPSSTYKITDTLTIQPATGSQVRLNIDCQGSYPTISYSGADSKSVFRTLGLKDSTWRNLRVRVPTASSVTVFDLDGNASYASSSGVNFIGCSCFLDGSGANNNGWRIGHSAGLTDNSFYQWLGCIVTGGAGTGNIGWVWEDFNSTALQWYGCGGSSLAKVYTNNSTGGNGGQGGSDVRFFGGGGTLNLIDFEFASGGSYGIYGYRGETGKVFLQTGSGASSMSIVVSDFSINNYTPTDERVIYINNRPVDLTLINPTAYGRDYQSTFIRGHNGGIGSIRIIGGAIRAAAGMIPFTSGGGNWNVDIDGTLRLDSANAPQEVFPNWHQPMALAYSATIATESNDKGPFTIVATNGTAFTISNPTNPRSGQSITYDIKNSSGGAMGTITWGGAFLLAGAFTNPANTKRRTITFYYDGTNWVETNRAAADI